MIEYLILLLAPIFSLIIKSQTKHEKEIYKKYIYGPTILAIFLILSIIFFFIDKTIHLSTLFIFIMAAFWLKE